MQWEPIETAPKDQGYLLGWVEGTVRFIQWGKTSHVPIYGWNLADQGAEDFDICHPEYWMPLPASPEPVCGHQYMEAQYDYSVCKDCGYILTDSGWGIASRLWFPDLSTAKFYKANGRMPEQPK